MSEGPIHVVHITATLSHLGGGTAQYVQQLAHEGLACGLMPTVAALHDPCIEQEIDLYQGSRVIISPYIGPRSVGYSPALAQQLQEEVSSVDVVHSHGLRSLPSYTARRFAHTRGVPRVVSPHGQLDPWILARHPLRKRVIGLLFENRNLRTAMCIHTTSNQEARYVRAMGLCNPVAVVPIGLDADQYNMGGDHAWIAQKWPELRNKKRLLFLSNIYRKKGLLRLAEAWEQLHKQWSDWQVVVAGIETDGDRALAQQRLEAAGVSGSVTFAGTVNDEEKKRLLSGCDLYVLPTDGENFGIVIAEAMASRLPVITSNTTPWSCLEQQQCGWWINVGVDPLCKALTEAMGLTDQQRSDRGARARKVIEDHYQWPTVASQMRGIYAWLLGRQQKPEFIYTASESIPV